MLAVFDWVLVRNCVRVCVPDAVAVELSVVVCDVVRVVVVVCEIDGVNEDDAEGVHDWLGVKDIEDDCD